MGDVLAGRDCVTRSTRALVVWALELAQGSWQEACPGVAVRQKLLGSVELGEPAMERCPHVPMLSYLCCRSYGCGKKAPGSSRSSRGSFESRSGLKESSTAKVRAARPR